ncbi:N-acetylmuramoyl-L-alanine amidase [Planococcus antarcticus DSM 14505]|uniref:N-acetylmuramoyl-L-alanine amidase n=1 Tax=Planococcus antarcticus DSM 14505 TaxID=1185653 RepID=A0AA87IK39_9BACL|nr:S-layer homology domain-containing protein [Planococcus antarcticus]EIM06211.1 N-acetylmuramoyl-L-alanine amidase [Planococcus antarcticus DSM 14505]
MKKVVNFTVIVLSLLLIFPVGNTAQAAGDLQKSHPFYEEIAYLMDKGVVTGYPDGTIRPDRVVTRAEAAVMIGRVKGFSEAQQETTFSDVPAGQYASGSIAEAARAGYIIGYKDGTYRPSQAVSRGDMALIIERVFDLNFIYFHDIKDVPDAAYYYDAITRLIAANIAIGYPDGTFQPKLEVTRGQFSAFLARALEPEFKNTAAIADSYKRDKTKTYTYLRNERGESVDRFVKVPGIDGGEDQFVWETQIGEERYPELEYETYKEFAIGYPYSDHNAHLAYPVRVGKTFVAAHNPEAVYYTITGVDQTVETEYRTFTNAVEITTNDGGKYYMVEGFAVVKWIQADGTIYSELKDVE